MEPQEEEKAMGRAFNDVSALRMTSYGASGQSCEG